MSYYTPGPWRERLGCIRSKQGVFIAEVGLPMREHGTHATMSLREGEANARLLAAAPDLLEALVSLLDGCECCCHGVNGEIEARAAIAKAVAVGDGT